MILDHLSILSIIWMNFDNMNGSDVSSLIVVSSFRSNDDQKLSEKGQNDDLKIAWDDLMRHLNILGSNFIDMDRLVTFASFF